MSEFTKASLRVVAWIAVFAMLGGGIYGALAVEEHRLTGLFRGMLIAGLITVAIAPAELFLLDQNWARRFREASFLVQVVAKSAYYLAAFFLAFYLVDMIAPVETASRERSWHGMAPKDLIFSIVMALAANIILAVNRLLGQGVLWSFVTGRYHRPKVEERIFLLIDMVDSTAIAERIGDIAFHRLLNRFFSDLGRVMIEHRGVIHKYVGDEMIVTWPAEAGSRGGPIRAALAATARLAGDAGIYEARFGLCPRFRAALHCGPVVSGEMGDLKQEIVFLGDALNTAARIEEACSDRGEDLLLSAALLARVPPPPGFRAVSLGPVQLRGKQEPVELFTLRPAAG